MNDEYERLQIIESLAEKLCTPMCDNETNILRRNTLEYTMRRRIEVAKRDELYRQIRIAQKNHDEILELKLFRNLNNLECKNA
ncbi:hypothetical protein PP590_gp62 [Pseudoalteromonas phage HS1]|uniref:hypothetical protein n=1 Tax=Pseudoalteromonas phage H105/1 TaxID=877240 RepID=UPI0001E43A6A|nr:hypothetical protein AV949_gp52 [Pseudoalteromonas phage H105/1]YP_010660090.1 hypothetical protein PP589_gp06 [Pseudoalteromonas phage HS5]YP_010660219.1 hypothetical protein PP590_gp62 [Pseudoalteromonas phage HS1]ADM26712.1 hypothetical protein [Pseudoalteromonas phage H105/1]